MWAIGTGAPAALSSLAFHRDRADFNTFSSEEEAVYFGLAAKFMAEASPYVGRETFVTVDRKRGELGYLLPEDIDKVRNIWEAGGRPRAPRDLLGRVQGIVSRGPIRGNKKRPSR